MNTQGEHTQNQTLYATVKFWYLWWRITGHEWWFTKSTSFWN